MKKTITLFIICCVAMAGHAQQASPIQFTKDLQFNCTQVPVNGIYKMDISQYQFAEKSATEVFAAISLPYARFDVDEGSKTVVLTINSEGYPKVSQWNLSNWQSHFTILSGKTRRLTMDKATLAKEREARKAKRAERAKKKKE